MTVAKVDVSKVRLIDEKKLGIDFFNEIDIWTKMEFNSREQISKLRNKQSPVTQAYTSTHSLHYSVREKLD